MAKRNAAIHAAGALFAQFLFVKMKMELVPILNAFDGRAPELNGEGRVMVLTPHPGEMARLAGMTIKEVEADRIGLARHGWKRRADVRPPVARDRPR